VVYANIQQKVKVVWIAIRLGRNRVLDRRAPQRAPQRGTQQAPQGAQVIPSAQERVKNEPMHIQKIE